jgi:hypothetical protein
VKSLLFLIFAQNQMNMTRNDARMIAEELYKLMQKDNREEQFMTITEASEYIKHSVSYLKQHKEIPRCKVGGRILFTKKQLTDWAVR